MEISDGLFLCLLLRPFGRMDTDFTLPFGVFFLLTRWHARCQNFWSARNYTIILVHLYSTDLLATTFPRSITAAEASRIVDSASTGIVTVETTKILLNNSGTALEHSYLWQNRTEWTFVSSIFSPDFSASLNLSEFLFLIHWLKVIQF